MDLELSIRRARLSLSTGAAEVVDGGGGVVNSVVEVIVV